VRQSPNRLITEEELNAAGGGGSVYQALERLRPLWLRNSTTRRGTLGLTAEIVVLMDGQYFGDVTSLRQLPLVGVGAIEYMSGSEATNAFPFLASGRLVDSAILVYYGASRNR
jgi:hypothetical protein